MTLPLLQQVSVRSGSRPNTAIGQQRRPHKASIWPGIALACAVALVALLLGHWWPMIGGPIFAILLGIGVRNSLGSLPLCRPGLHFASNTLLQWSIIFLGFGLSMQQVLQVGRDSMGIMLITIAAAFVAAFILGRLLGVSNQLRSLIGAGTAICGGSAIAAIAPIIKPQEHETALAISTIFLFNLVAVIVFPALGHALGMSELGFGLWAATAINDTSSVVAAAYSYGNTAGNYATIVKLTRATFIIPLCLFYVGLELHRHHQQRHQLSAAAAPPKIQFTRLIPWFIIWFVCASAIRSTGLLPAEILLSLDWLAKFLMVLALAAIGLSSNIQAIAKAGWQPLVLGLGTWLAVVITSLAVQIYSGAW